MPNRLAKVTGFFSRFRQNLDTGPHDLLAFQVALWLAILFGVGWVIWNFLLPSIIGIAVVVVGVLLFRRWWKRMAEEEDPS